MIAVVDYRTKRGRRPSPFDTNIERTFPAIDIDLIVREAGDGYDAIIKDERYPSFEWLSGKNITLGTQAMIVASNFITTTA